MDKAQFSEEIPVIYIPRQKSFVNTHLSVTKVAVFLLVAVSLSFHRIKSNIFPFSTHPSHDFLHLAGHCAHVTPVSSLEFLGRQQALAEILYSLNASAYIAEPGPSAHYYANISTWGLSERPLLLIISPQLDGTTVKPNVSILTPYFEKTRAQLMDIPSKHPLTFATWREEVDPFETAISAISSLAGEGPIFVDGELRVFIWDGLSKAAPSTPVLSTPVEIQRLRQRKSAKEIEIMRCANEVTLLAVRAVREKMYIGISQSEVKDLLEQAQDAAGLVDQDALVLFGENAGRPHGGGEDSKLGRSDFVLIDTTAALHSYYSDLTRTFVLPSSALTRKQIHIWYAVQEAQTAALAVAKNGSLTRTVDEAARLVLKRNGLDEYFTHRLGHGIGLQVHESPYLRGGSEDILLTGHTFSDEPGVYIDGEVGVRLEDSFFIDENGDSVYLTQGVGGQATSPWTI